LKNNLLLVAHIGKTVGLKGFLRLHIDSDFPEQFKKGNSFLLKDNRKLVINSFDGQLVKFEGFLDIEDAKKLSGLELFSTLEDSRQRCKLSKDEFFWFDIIGLKVVENNQTLGIVKSIERINGIDMLLLDTDDSLSDRYSKEFFIPYNDNYIISVDINNKIIETKNSFDILEAS
jgi:16S rRNA processing protein RimM